MSSKKGQKHIYAQEYQLYYYYNKFRGHSERESKAVQLSDILNIASVASAFILQLRYFIVQKHSLSHELKTLAESC